MHNILSDISCIGPGPKKDGTENPMLDFPQNLSYLFYMQCGIALITASDLSHHSANAILISQEVIKNRSTARYLVPKNTEVAPANSVKQSNTFVAILP